jgi:serine/threonine-protein kinase
MSEVMTRLSAALADRYRVERELGAGGMATVYLAHDLKHDRDVAIKVLHPELAAALGGDRFLSEIKTTAKLQHPHILPLLDSGDADGLLYYVMPYVTGETLRSRLERERQLPIDDALRIAREVADALGAAHALGIIHRDIKPENILLQGGHALVADFGIALAVQQAGGARMTQTGLSLGTPHYMSPEQAMGDKTIDARTDIYALGAVTYEMLAGDPPFAGSSVQAIVAKVLSERPTPLAMLRDTVPPGVEHAVLTALAKLPADRQASAAAFISSLGDGAAAGGAAASTPSPSTRAAVARSSRWLRMAIIGNIALALGVAALLLRPAPELPTSRQHVVLWKRSVPAALAAGAAFVGTQAAIAPDGSSIVYADSSDGWMLMRKRRDASTAELLAGTEGAISPFFSPDGKWIGFVTIDGKLKKLPVAGGSPMTLAEDVPTDYKSGAWLDDGTIVYGSASTMARLPSAGGSKPRKLRVPSVLLSQYLNIAALPGSRGFLFTGCQGNCAFTSDAWVYDFAADSARVLVPQAAGIWYSPTGHVLYAGRDGGLFAIAFDAKTLKTHSEAVPVIDGVRPGGFAISPSGSILYALDAAASAPSELVWVDRQGRASPFDSTWRGKFEYPALSPDGRSLAVSERDKLTDLWIHHADGSRHKVNTPGTANWRPAWLADGKSLTFVSVRDPLRDPNDVSVYRVPSDAGVAATQIFKDRFGVYEAEISPDTQWLVVRIDEDVGSGNIYARRLHGDTARQTLVANPSADMQIVISPTGKWLAYTIEERGAREVYIASFPDMKIKRQVSRGGGTEPRWARSGREIFFESRGQLMVAAVAAGAALEVGEPRVLFSLAGYRRARNRPQYDVAPGDQRFLMIKEPPAPPVPTIVYVEHWFAELLAKVKP